MNAPSFLGRRLRFVPSIVLVLLLVAPAAARSAGATAAPVTVTGIPAAAGVQVAGVQPSSGAGATFVWPQTVLSTVVPPVFFDLDHDGTLDVIAADDRYAYVFDHLGTLRPGWPVDVGGAMMQAAVADLDGDGVAEILVGSTVPAARLSALTPSGATRWVANLPSVNLSNTTCPVVADLDGDDHLDVGIATETGVSFFDAGGAPLPGWPYTWPVPINNPQWSAPAVGDLDNDGALEVVVGNACYPDWGVHAIRADGTAMPGWPKVILPVWSSPALADLDADGDLEIIAQEGDPGSIGYRMWVWHHTGAVFAGWPRAIAADGQSSRSSPAIGDLDGDGDLEIVTATSDGRLHVLQPDGTELAGWPRATGGVQPIASPALIDMDADGSEEMFLTYWLANAQYVSGWRLDGTVLAGFPKLLLSGTDMNSHSSVHVADVEGDGDLELAVSATSFNQGQILVLAVDASTYDPLTSRHDWPKMRRDMENTGAYGPSGTTAAEAAPPAAAIRLTVAPNPAGAGRAVRIATGKAGWLAAYDASGRVRGRAALGGGEALLALGGPGGLLGQNAAPGVYFLRFTPEGDESATARLVVLRR